MAIEKARVQHYPTNAAQMALCRTEWWGISYPDEEVAWREELVTCLKCLALIAKQEYGWPPASMTETINNALANKELHPDA